jgi:hypothetical protein
MGSSFFCLYNFIHCFTSINTSFGKFSLSSRFHFFTAWSRSPPWWRSIHCHWVVMLFTMYHTLMIRHCWCMSWTPTCQWLTFFPYVTLWVIHLHNVQECLSIITSYVRKLHHFCTLLPAVPKVRFKCHVIKVNFPHKSVLNALPDIIVVFVPVGFPLYDTQYNLHRVWLLSTRTLNYVSFSYLCSGSHPFLSHRLVDCPNTGPLSVSCSIHRTNNSLQ